MTMTIAVYADIETSSAGYKSRFAGAAGRWLLGVQSRILIEQLSQVWVDSDQSISLLDVGGGHGQIVQAINEHGLLSRCQVTVLGSSQECREQLVSDIEAGRCTFAVGDLLTLPYPDKSFDVVTSFRFIPHCEQWQQLIRELCRVARQAVIVDYPTHLSVNCLSPFLFHLKKVLERNTRTFAMFSHRQISAAFAEAEFVVQERSGEFFLPMVVHRMLKSPGISGLLEAPFGILNITKFLGSPVIVRATPKG